MAQVKLDSNTRDNSGKGVARKLRAAGRVPGILYGPTIEPLRLDFQEKALMELLQTHGLNPIINLTVGKESHLCMIKDLQRDVYQKKVLHIDLRRVDLTEMIEVNVRLHLEGEEVLRAKGAIVEQTLRNLRLRMLPTNIPEAFTVDISGLKLGKTITASEVALPENVVLLSDPEAPIVNIFAARGAVLTEESQAE